MGDDIRETAPAPASATEPAQLDYARAGGKMVAIARFPTWLEANMICVVLESQNIRAKMQEPASHAQGSRPGTVLVPAESVENAVDVLASTPARRCLTVPPDQIPPARVMKVLFCPQCESVHVTTTRLAWKIGLGVLILAWMPVISIYAWPWFAGLECGWLVYLFLSRKWRCRACNHTWAVKPDDEPDRPQRT